MQPTGRSVPSSARALIADGGQRNVKLCGRGLDGPQLMRISLGNNTATAVHNAIECELDQCAALGVRLGSGIPVGVS